MNGLDSLGLMDGGLGGLYMGDQMDRIGITSLAQVHLIAGALDLLGEIRQAFELVDRHV